MPRRDITIIRKNTLRSVVQEDFWYIPRVDRDTNRPIPIMQNTPEWFQWFEDNEAAHFEVQDRWDYGGLTLKKEKKQRGGEYWVAYRRIYKRLYKTYIGKSDQMSIEKIIEAHKRIQEKYATHSRKRYGYDPNTGQELERSEPNVRKFLEESGL